MSEAAFFDSALRRELKKIYLKTLGLRATAGLVSFITVVAWSFVFVVVWAALTKEPVLWQTVLVSRATLVVWVLLFIYFVIYPIVRMPRFSHLALEVESRKDFQHIVAAGYEFSQRDDLADSYSQEIVREVIRQAVESISGLRVRFLFLEPRQLVIVPTTYLILIVLAVFALVSPSSLFRAGSILVAPESASAEAHTANLFGSPGDLTVLAGSDVEVRAFDFGETEQPVTLAYNLSEGFWKTEPTAETDQTRPDGSSLKTYIYTFRRIRSSVTYYFQAGDVKSPEYRIDVVHHPIVTRLNVVLTPPQYTGEPADTLLDNGGNVQALEGTAVSVSALANNVLANAWVRFGSGDNKPVRFSQKDLEFDFVALEDDTYSIFLEDEAGHKTDEPLAYSINVYRDNPPLLDVLEPGADATLPRSLVVDVGFITSDDYGVARASIFYRKNGEEKYRTQAIALGAEKGKREVAAAFEWDLSDIPLFPGNYVEYFLEVADNNVVTGPGIARSPVFHIAVPTMAELYEGIKEEEGHRADLLEQTVTESRELKERLEKLTREFKKTENMDWAQQKEVDKAIASQEQIEEKLGEIEQSLEETLQSLSDNQMTSQEIGEKLEEIKRLIEEINDDALNRYIEELREAMEKLNPNEIQKALENLDVSAQELLENLERTESLLKQIQEEQELEEAVREAKDLMDEQEALIKETEAADEGDSEKMDELADQQEELSEKAKELAEKLQKMAENSESQDLSEQMEQMSEEFSESGAMEDMQQASQQLQQGQKQQAQANQQQAKQDMITLFRKLATCQAQMNNAAQQKTAANLQRLAKSTLELSFKQEALTNRLRDQVATEEVSNVRALAKDQQMYTRATEQIADELHQIAKQSLSVSEALLEALGRSIDGMRNTTLFLDQSKAFMGAASASQAVTSLNEATIELLTAAESCTSGGGGGSAQQMSALQQMLNQQQQILQESQALLEMRAAQEKLLQQRQASIKRLAGRQRSLRDMVEQMEDDLKDNKRILGRMEKMTEEMEEVIRDLDSGVLDEQTIRNEERILSRLLDANRSVHSRDYEKRRLSETAEDVFSGAKGAEVTKSASQLLREEIRRAMSLKAPGEFEDLIRLYFRALAEEAPLAADDE
jgi:hypothetical protein